MISIRKYLDGPDAVVALDELRTRPRREKGDALAFAIGVYRSVLDAMGRGSIEVCPATGVALEKGLAKASQALAGNVAPEAISQAGESVDRQVQEWSRQTARHLQEKAAEVKEMLLVMARTAESVGERDRRCSEQIDLVTTQLRRIASLEDISVMRSSIEKSATDLKTSIDRLTAEGREVLDGLQARVTAFQEKLEEAEKIASCDALTRLRSRLWVEGQLEQRIAAGATFCIAILDLDDFKVVNDAHGHVIGDELLRQFARELRSTCRASDIVGRWGGDEFIVLFDGELSMAAAQIERVTAWVCGKYQVEGASGAVALRVDASVGLAAYTPPETLKQLLDRADTAMYKHKAAARAAAKQAVKR